MSTGIIIALIVVGGVVALALIGAIKDIISAVISIRHIRDIEESAKRMAEFIKKHEE